MEERLLGYDAREMWLNYPDNWTQERRNLYLLREDLIKPLSTDSMVWDEVTDLYEIENPKAYTSEYGPYFELVKPAQREDSWRFLGYDISDPWMLSGLMNCGYTPPEDVESLRKTWSRYLNEYHLFEDFDRAKEFRDLADKRVKEHAPFSVYGIYLAKQVV